MLNFKIKKRTTLKVYDEAGVAHEAFMGTIYGIPVIQDVRAGDLVTGTGIVDGPVFGRALTSGAAGERVLVRFR